MAAPELLWASSVRARARSAGVFMLKQLRPMGSNRAHCFSDGKALPKKYRELIHLCLLAYRFAPDRTLMAHLKRAKEAGASTRELMEAFETAMIAGGVPTYIHGMNALLRLEGVIEDGEKPRRRAPAQRR